jgi:cysteine-rich repeat protein
MMPKCNDGIVDNVAPWNEQCDCGEEGANFDWEAHKDDPMSPYCEVDFEGHPALCHMGMCTVQYCGDGFQFNPGMDRESGTADDEMCDAGPLNSNVDTSSGKCENNAQCVTGVCIDGECADNERCSSNNDCNGGKCLNGICAAGGCNADKDCSDGKKCYEGQCQSSQYGFSGQGSCTTDNDCPSGNCYPNGFCAPKLTAPPATYCRLDCKPARCGDGIVDVSAGETCDEGAKMFKCNGYPQPSCDCGIPSWGSQKPGVGPYNTTCCAEGQYCSVWATDTCPADCGVGKAGAGLCGNHVLEPGEECDASVPGWQGPSGDWADAQVDYAYRPNRDGTQTAFVSDDGKWSTFPASIEEKYTTIDHAPSEGGSPDPDGAYIVTAGQGTAKTYFHLWDIPLTSNTTFSSVRIQAAVDFAGKGSGWRCIELRFAFANGISAVDMNAAVLEIVADENAHTLTFRLYNSTTGVPLTLPLVMQSPGQLTTKSKIAVDAVQVAAFGTSLDASYSCSRCVLARCGNKIVEKDKGETCDDGNAAGGDGCSDRCELEICALPQ